MRVCVAHLRFVFLSYCSDCDLRENFENRLADIFLARRPEKRNKKETIPRAERLRYGFCIFAAIDYCRA